MGIESTQAASYGINNPWRSGRDTGGARRSNSRWSTWRHGQQVIVGDMAGAKSVGSAMAGAQTTTAGVGSAGSAVAGAGRRYGAGMGRSLSVEALDPAMEALDPCAADPPTPLASRCVPASSYPPS